MTASALIDVKEDTQLGLLLAMRPVFAKNLEVIAFDPVIQTLDGKAASADDYHALGLVVSESYSSVPSQSGERALPSFLPISSGLLRELSLPIFPADRYIFQVQPQGNESDEDLDRYRALANQSYRVAVLAAESHPPRLEEFLQFAAQLKVDVAAVGVERARELARQGLQSGLELTAINLTSKADFIACMEMGFTGFSGDVLGKPQPSDNQRLGNNKLVLMQLLTELQKPGTDIGTLERIILKDPNLTFKILKIVNSAAVGLAREVKSVSQAISILGMSQMQRWAGVLLLEDNRGKPMELMREALVRARMCEVIAEASSREHPLTYFLTALLSKLDVMTDIPMSQIVTQIPLSDDIKRALTSREGDPGKVLLEVENYLQGIFPAENATMNKAFYEPCFRHSTAWAAKVQLAAA